MIEVKAYAGLIRNHKELAAELGVCTDGMTREQREMALMAAAYQQWGTDMGNHINGQFGAALYDTEKQELFAVRDILGAELFFYYQTADGRVLVGNDIKDLFDQPGFERALNPRMVQFYLAFTYLPGEETLFKGVWKLEPGGYLTYSAERGLELGKYWELTFEPDESKTLEQWADELTDAMEASLRDICEPDQECDSFLSGGVDSSYILAKSRARTGFCAAYANQDVSEEEEARATAQLLGRGFEGLRVTPEEFLANVDEFLLAYELPTADVAGLSLYCAAKQMKEGGKSTLCFSGEGADEFFAGYSVYAPKPWWRKLLNPVYYGTTYIMNAREQARFAKEYFPSCTTANFIAIRAAKGYAYDELGRKLYTDLRTYFEGSILYNSTKISRGTGLDIRMPYCDLRIFDIARRMPSRFKAVSTAVDGNKIALRAAARRVLPQEVAYRKKLGFPVPVRQWLAEPAFISEIERALTSDAAKQLLNEEEMADLLAAFKGQTPAHHARWYRRHQPLLWRYVWTCYTLVRWYELFLQ
ncbi:MAG: asparagine synthase-related protein [Eggerthellales bacterium]|nr:asparagine synthase-related protein [Eggerthellales bacterium]